MRKAISLTFCFTTLLLLVVGCSNAENEALTLKLEQREANLETALLENQHLKARLSQSARQYEELQMAYENIALKEAETAQWAEHLANHIGPCVWYFGTDERPLPKKPLKKRAKIVQKQPDC